MERKVVLYIAMSLDGYIAKTNGDMRWLHEKVAKSDVGYHDFYKSVDTIVMGRMTYDKILDFGPWPYQDKECFVFSHTKECQDEHVHFTSMDVDLFTKALLAKEGKNIWLVGGAAMIDHFIKNKLVDHVCVTVIPTVLGDGLSLFQKGHPEMHLKLLKTLQYEDIVQLDYEVVH